MTTEEAFAFLARGHTGILTSLRRDGRPVALPVWFATKDGRVYVSTPSRTKKVARIRNDDRVSFLVESGERWADLKAVHLSGRARIVRATDLLEEVGRLLDAKYSAFRTARSAMPAATRRHYQTLRTVIEIVPDERVLSWDNTKLRLGEEPE